MSRRSFEVSGPYVLPKRGVVGYEVVERYDRDPGLGAQIALWLGDWNRQHILDRRSGKPAVRRCIASVNAREDGRYTVITHAGAKGGWRYTTAPNYEAALAQVDAWVQRRFTPKQ